MFLIKVIWFFLPAYAANIAASILKINFLNFPISENFFGSHKTYRGFFFGVIFALFIAFIQKILFSFDFFQKISFLDYKKNFLLIGFLLGFGALFGDLIKSFLKRRLKILPGERWIPFDQIDYTLGALFFIFFLWRPTMDFILISIFLNFFLHIFINHLGFWLGIRKGKW